MNGALIRGAATAALLALPAVAQGPASPAGTWEIEMRDSRYRVELCGDGTQLCGRLIWLGNGADNAENLPYLNTMLIDHAPRTGPNQWRGELHLFGQSAAGTITQVGPDQISLRGCFLGIICRTYQMYRYGG
jgi:uncharacterized protein (DUF2147 family)